MKSAAWGSFDDLPLSLTVLEADAALRIGRSTAYNLVRCGKIRSVKVGKQLRVPKSALMEFLEAS